MYNYEKNYLSSGLNPASFESGGNPNGHFCRARGFGPPKATDYRGHYWDPPCSGPVLFNIEADDTYVWHVAQKAHWTVCPPPEIQCDEWGNCGFVPAPCGTSPWCCAGQQRTTYKLLGGHPLADWYAATQAEYNSTRAQWNTIEPAKANTKKEGGIANSVKVGVGGCDYSTNAAVDLPITYTAGSEDAGRRPNVADFTYPWSYTALCIQTKKLSNVILRKWTNPSGTGSYTYTYEKKDIASTATGYDGKDVVILEPAALETHYVKGLSPDYDYVLAEYDKQEAATP